MQATPDTTQSVVGSSAAPGPQPDSTIADASTTTRTPLSPRPAAPQRSTALSVGSSTLHHGRAVVVVPPSPAAACIVTPAAAAAAPPPHPSPSPFPALTNSSNGSITASAFTPLQQRLPLPTPTSSFTQCAELKRASALTPHASNGNACRFTCCRCRRWLLVRPGERCSSTAASLCLLPPSLFPEGAGRKTAHNAVPSAVNERARCAATTVASSPLSASSASAGLRAAVAGSYATRGTGKRFRPLQPVEAAERVTASNSSEEQRTGQSINAESPSSPRLQQQLQHRWAFVEALQTCVALPAEVLSTAQLEQLLTNAQEEAERELMTGVAEADPTRTAATASPSVCFANPHSLRRDVQATSAAPAHRGAECCEVACDWNGNACRTSSASPDGFRYGSDTQQLLDVSQLAALGVPVRAAATTMIGRRSSGTPNTSHAELHSSLTLSCSGSDGEANRHDASSVPSADLHSLSCSPPNLTKMHTAVMLSPSEEGAENAGRDVTKSSTPATPLGPALSETREVEALQYASVVSEDGPAAAFTPPPSILHVPRASTPPPPPAPVLPLQLCSAAAAAPPAATGTTTTAAVPTLPVDELYRRWMRLLTHHTTSLHPQPLCLSCWLEACLAPLQRQAKEAMEATETLATVLHHSSAEERRRLLTRCCCVTPSNTSSSGSTCDFCTRPQQAAPSSSLSLDSVAANLFGEREAAWLSRGAALSAPLESRLREASCTADSSAAQGQPLLVQAAQCSAEAQSLMAELAAVQEQQSALDTQLAELTEVLHAMGNTTAHDPLACASSPLCALDTEDDEYADIWAARAAAHNSREVQLAFTARDEAAERQHTMHDLAARFAYISATPIDALCFPIDVSGPIGTIAGLRLGLVPPYVSGSSVGAAAPASPPLLPAAQRSASGGSGRIAEHQSHQEPQQHPSHGKDRGKSTAHGTAGAAARDAADDCAVITEEVLCLEGFVRRQEQYTQLLLSGNTAATGSGHNPSSQGAATAAKPDSTKSSSGGESSSPAHTRVALPEVNAACGYLLLLLNYLAHVNGFAFQNAVLRPAGDRGTVGLLKRVASGSSYNPAAAATTSAIPFSFFGFFTGGASTATTASNSPPTAATIAAAAAASAARPSTRLSDTLSSSASSSYVVDREVDFYITDRLLAWRTFGAACVIVAACVKELADALHDSLRCWRLREGMVRRHAQKGSQGDAEEKRNTGEDEEGKGCRSELSMAGDADSSACACYVAPLSLPRLVDRLMLHCRTRENHHRPKTVTVGTPLPESDVEVAQTAEVRRNGGEGLAADPLNATGSNDGGARADPPDAPPPFPLHPPFRIQDGTVDGFSVRHGSVSEAIWTLGMKKLLANVQWCVGATVELERLYAVTEETGEGAEADA